jgi:hypothetical protein
VPFYGLRWWNAKGWNKVWDYSDYEPDPVIAAYSGLGDLRQFGKCVVFGSMHPPGSGSQGIIQEYDETELSPTNPAEIGEKAYRSLSVFRACPGEDVELLYGEEELPVFTPGSGWANQQTGMGSPKFGEPSEGALGSDGRNQNYFWSMGVLDGQLCFGTQQTSEQNAPTLSNPTEEQGGNLYCFPDTNSPANLVDQSGLGNGFNSGYRNIVKVKGSLYLATSNGANLNPNGGFELIRLDTVPETIPPSQ